MSPGRLTPVYTNERARDVRSEFDHTRRPHIGIEGRHRTAEQMDQADLDPAAHLGALAGLARINWISRSASILWPSVARVAARRADRPTRVLDVATGGGDVPIALARRAERLGYRLELSGCDRSPVAIEHARQSAGAAGGRASFFVLDVLDDALPDDFDVVTCSLFLHHLGEDDAARLLEKMARAARSTVLVNDLLRTRMGLGLAWLGCRLLSDSPIVHHDGPASVRAAFRLPEVRALADRAGLAGARLSRRWPERFLLEWSCESA